LFHEIIFRMLANNHIASFTFKRMPVIPYNLLNDELLKSVDALIEFDWIFTHDEYKNRADLFSKSINFDKIVDKLEDKIDKMKVSSIDIVKLLYYESLKVYYSAALNKLDKEQHDLYKKLESTIKSLSNSYGFNKSDADQTGVDSPHRWAFRLIKNTQEIKEQLNQSFLNKISEQKNDGAALLKFFFGKGKRWVFTNVDFE